ncbi:BPSL0761 family protein [Xanthomonas campestris pv. campestris]|uniref:BPSL0761 family protein n=1 Tax=Xanthomonas campestris TaxID=339 RepID=UPI002B3E9B89|nr:BPSL0761 family protein [Xanthomonas campestris pv. campestris]WVL70442.1 BPSL0761 family protein [Xanthomonas campestris pv. campestris]
MTTPEESTRHLFQAGAFLVELALDERLPIEVRREAARLTRHYPTPECSLAVTPSVIGNFLPEPEPGCFEGYRHGPLTVALSDRISRLYYELGNSRTSSQSSSTNREPRKKNPSAPPS